jgi:streptogramin lyase
MLRTTSVLSLLALTTTGLACEPAPAGDATTEVTASILIASPDVRCLRVQAVGSTTVTTQADVQGQTASTLALTGIPVGSVTFTASAFSVRCASAATATYVSDPVTMTVVAGTPLALSFKMRPASSTGAGSAVLDFPQAHGRTEEFMMQAGSGATVISVDTGPDGNIWLGMGPQGVGVMSPAGKQVANFGPVNPSTGSPYYVYDGAFGPDDNYWFVDPSGTIGRMTTSGTTKGFSAPGTAGGMIAAGPDGNMWFTDGASQRIGKITPLGVVTFYPFPVTPAYPYAIAAGADGNLWVTEYSGSRIAKVTSAGAITEYALPVANSRPEGIVAGPDGNLWFVEYSGNKVARITTAGVITEYPFATTGMLPTKITRGADGNLWVACNGGAIAKVTTAGVITVYPAGADGSSPTDITAGPDGNVWFAESPRVGRLAP